MLRTDQSPTTVYNDTRHPSRDLRIIPVDHRHITTCCRVIVVSSLALHTVCRLLYVSARRCLSRSYWRNRTSSERKQRRPTSRRLFSNNARTWLPSSCSQAQLNFKCFSSSPRGTVLLWYALQRYSSVLYVPVQYRYQVPVPGTRVPYRTVPYR